VKRDRLEIIRDILCAVNTRNGRIRPTQLMYKANLSHQALQAYTDLLVRKGFLSESGSTGAKTYSLSERGFEFLRRYEMMREFLDVFGIDEESG
jgi:predicted transcriptional regulator